MSRSQPSDCLLLLQSAKPASHIPVHAPLPHSGVAMWLPLQTVVHTPQWLGSPSREISQPLVRRSPSQSPKPVTQAPVHPPLMQLRDPIFTLLLEHTWLQPPQLSGSPLS